MKPVNEIRCYFCNKSVDSVIDAIEIGWEPSFFDGDDQVAEPCCPKCVEKYLREGSDGELELIPDVAKRFGI